MNTDEEESSFKPNQWTVQKIFKHQYVDNIIPCAVIFLKWVVGILFMIFRVFICSLANASSSFQLAQQQCNPNNRRKARKSNKHVNYWMKLNAYWRKTEEKKIHKKCSVILGLVWKKQCKSCGVYCKSIRHVFVRAATVFALPPKIDRFDRNTSPSVGRPDVGELYFLLNTRSTARVYTVNKIVTLFKLMV